ncbi:Bromodomain-containing protein 8, partial [Chelonia mydas]
VGENEMTVTSGHMNSSGVLLEVGGVLPVLHGGEMQLASGAVPASPAASGAPTLSRLLEAGPAQFTTPLASFSAVASEPPAKLLPPPVESVSQATIAMMPTLSAPSVVPPAATPESVATVSQSDTCVSMEAVSDPHTVTVSMDSSEISMIIDSIKKECLGTGTGSAAGPSKDHSMDGKEDLDLAEKMDIAVSYTGEELDFETVGDIIAIIEDKVDDHPEVLDVAAVEAALSFCEETDDPQALTGPSQPLKRDNTESLINDIQQIREQWDAILTESKLVAQNIGISSEFSTNRNLPTESDAEQHYRVNVFLVVIDSIQSGLTRRFESLCLICTLLGFLWQFNRLSNEDLLSAAEQFQQQYNKEISKGLSDKFIFLKQIYSMNFKLNCTPKELLQEMLELGLSGVFPNITLALRIFVSLPASVALGERTFNVLKQVKNYHRSTMGQEHVNGLAMLNINYDIAQKRDFSSIISAFAEKKARKAFVK